MLFPRFIRVFRVFRFVLPPTGFWSLGCGSKVRGSGLEVCYSTVGILDFGFPVRWYLHLSKDEAWSFARESIRQRNYPLRWQMWDDAVQTL